MNPLLFTPFNSTVLELIFLFADNVDKVMALGSRISLRWASLNHFLNSSIGFLFILFVSKLFPNNLSLNFEFFSLLL